jgi:N-acetylglutamate synthase-like GNAT family acetyltransferase
MSMRAAAAQDLPGIKALLQRSASPTADLEQAHIAFWVEERDGELTGAIGLQRFDTVSLLRSLAVDASRRGQGTGAELVRLLEARAQAQGVEQLVLLTQTAQAFFARRGYGVIAGDAAPAAVRGTEEFRSLCPASAVCMAKVLVTRNAPA